MIEERIVVSDSNIFFDLLSVDLLSKFFLLPCEITTSDFVINEITKPNQQKEINTFINSKKLYVKSFSYDELMQIMEIHEKNANNASVTDCSVWYYAKKTSGRLLTGDGKLKASATLDNVKVSGILYIFDNLIEYKIMDKLSCADKLEKLARLNMRLPKNECEKRITEWRK